MTPQGAAIEITVGKPRLLHARRLLAAGEHSSAVIAAQSASETFVKQVVCRLLHISTAVSDPAAELERISSWNLYSKNKNLRDLYERLTGDAGLRHQRFWASGELTAHVARRIDAGHGGAVLSEEDAQRSLAAVEALVAHVDAAAKAAGLTWV